MKFNRKWLAGGLILAVLVVPFVVKQAKGDAGVEVDIAEAVARDIRPTILASGVLAYRDEVKLTAELVAQVSMIAVEEGSMVEAGELLLKLDPETYLNAIEREQATRRQSVISIERQRVALALRKKQFERSEQLVKLELIDQDSFDQVRNQLRIAQVELKSSEEELLRADAVLSEAREQLEKTEVRSPIAGQVVSLPIKVGETAIPSTSSLAGAQLMTIADTTAIQAELQVDEADIAKVAAGQQVDIYAAAYPETALEGVVEMIALAPTIEGQGRAYKVTVDIEVPDGIELRSGMSARADIFLSDGTKKLAVPVEAIVSDTGEDKKVTRHVWLQRDGKAKKVEVETGASDDRWEEVTKGLEAGDQVIVGPARTLRTLQDGDAVTRAEDSDREDTASDNDDEDGDGESASQ
ncbi:efflux RND transporter periplasmic adaptor subunit [Lysobacter sp. F60174L2]|uniref:efflux RND transporter periplasmic adaptor subunit n=1 Tax=Lysobacter sp. F60174L2 TaxID=3459295 RepID=UPI00403D6611